MLLDTCVTATMGRQVKLADGTSVTVEQGSFLPGNLHPDFEFIALPSESIAATQGEPIFIKTSIAQRDRNVEHMRNMHPEKREGVLEAAARSIRNAMPGHKRVYASMMRGETRGKKKWQNFIDDCNIILSHQLVQGDALKVFLDAPEVKVEGGVATISAPLFLMRL